MAQGSIFLVIKTNTVLTQLNHSMIMLL